MRLLPILLLLCVQVVAQSTFTARVVDAETGEPLPLVSVYISEDNGTLTNFDGEFSIMADSTDLLRITCVGRESINVVAGTLPAELRMKMLASSLSEVTIKAVEGTLLQIARRMEKAYGKRKYKEAQYFYRQTSVLLQKQDIVEAFISARSAVNLRELQFLTGRHGRLSEAAWGKSAINNMNLHHLLELGPMTKDASFWYSLIAPLKANNFGMLSGIEYLQRYYDITVEEMNGEDQQLYRFVLQRHEATKVKAPIMTGALYVDRRTLSVLAFDGKVENLTISLGKGELRSATSLPVVFDVHINYRYDHKFPEVADLSIQAKWADFQTRTMLFNVEGQKHLKQKKGTHARENMLTSIEKVGYDSTFWANNEVIKRTAEEAAIAEGTVDLQKARLDSVAAAQEALPPLERLADRLERFGKTIPQEKVYVHMDNTCYYLGDTIWFSAYSRRTDTDKPSRISRVLYAELWNHDGYLVERKLVEMQNGRGHGFFALPDTLYSGYFELRAYTRWQLNWGQTEHYHIGQTEYRFYNRAMAKDFFRDYEKLYSRVFPVYDKPKEEGDFYKDMTFRPLRRYFKSAPKPAELRLSLFPEGGNMVAGVPCRVAFEAATSEGEVCEGSLSLRVKNERVSSEKSRMKNERGELVDYVTTENRGRGTFIFTPEKGKTYEVEFKPKEDESSLNAKSITLNAIKADGVALQVNRDSASGDWLFTIHAAGKAAQQPLGLTVMSEGRLLDFHTIDPSTHPLVHSSTIQNSKLPTGVCQVTVFDSIGHVYADRLFFVTRPDAAQPTIMLSGLKEQYHPYEQVDLDVTSAHLMPGQTISLAVRDAALQDNTFDSGNIMTEMLLASEIKGFVPQPEYFFERDDEEHRRALDLLMLTQGWRRFSWQDMAIKGAWELTHPAEHTQMVSGTVNRYYASYTGWDENYERVLNDHISFMTSNDPPLSELFGESHYADPNNYGASRGSINQGYGSITPQGVRNYNQLGFNGFAAQGSFRSMASPQYGWNLTEQKERPSYFRSTSHLAPFQAQQPEWRNDDYNVLSYHTTNRYRERLRERMSKSPLQYLEEGSVRKEVRVHAEFVSTSDENDFLIGETTTNKGRFQIDLPRFEGECVFFLSASDSSKWSKKKRHEWVRVDPTDEYSTMLQFPEYYIRLNFPYPRWVKPYTYYQVHNAPLRDTTFTGSRLLTDGTNMLEQVTIRARHGGLRRIDYSKPAYVLDAYEAFNLAMDAGLIDYTFSAHDIARAAATSLVGDMGMHRHYGISVFNDSRPGYFRGYLEHRRMNMLTFMDKMYFYTDYSPRREGDERYDQSNQPSVNVDLRRYPDGSQRVTYIDRRYILHGFAYQEDFYNPDYQRTPPTDQTRDYRRTLYWNPALKLDANGRAHVRLFTGTRSASLTVDAAGQAADGSLLFNK